MRVGVPPAALLQRSELRDVRIAIAETSRQIKQRKEHTMKEHMNEQAAAGTAPDSKLVYIPIGQLHPHPDNPRKDLGDLSELAESIKAKGVMQNLTVVPRDEGGYTVIIGHRRMGASKLAGLSELPCVVVEMSPMDQLSTMLLENIQRSDLTAYEQAQGFQMMIDFGDTVEGIAHKTGFSKKTVKHRLEMAKLDKRVLKEVSGKQVSMADFENLARIKSIEKRNEVLSKIGTYNFNNAVENALREELIAERMPTFLEKVRALGAKAMRYEDRWSSKFEQIHSVDVKEADEDKPIVPKKYLKEPLFYSMRSYTGTLEIYRKRPKEDKKKRPAAEIEREKAIDECKKGLKQATETARTLRENFAKQIVMNAKNRDRVLTGAVAALTCGIFSYQYSVPAKQVLEFVGEDVDNDYQKNRDALRVAIAGEAAKVIPAMAYLCLENAGNEKYYQEQYNDFPKHKKSEHLDALYDWLASLGYEMSDEETMLRDGTHPLFEMGKTQKDPEASAAVDETVDDVDPNGCEDEMDELQVDLFEEEGDLYEES